MTDKTSIPHSEWKWYGNAGHFLCGRWCRFHLCTEVGKYVISTIGEYVHPRNSGSSERTELEWLSRNHPGEDVGYGRKYETMVFAVSGHCQSAECGCGLPDHNGIELDVAGCNDAATATANHMRLCEKWASGGDES